MTDTAADPEPTTAPERMAVAFAHVLRTAELDVPVGTVTTFVEALGRVGIDDRDRVYWAGRTTLVRRPEDIPLFDRAFAVFWFAAEQIVARPDEPIEITFALDSDDGDEPDEGEGDGIDDGIDVAVRWSASEVLSRKDFADCSDAEIEEIRRLMTQLRVASSRRRARRHRRTNRQRGRPDLRRTVRRAMRTGGDPARRLFTAPDDRPRRIVLLLDVSGSMEHYARALLRFAHVAVAGRSEVEAFTFGTRLTRVTRELDSRDPDAAFRSATTAVEDWSGGTRIGAALREFNDEWGVRGMARGSIVVILSDGWDRGEPEVLGEQMARLSRVAHRVVWVNPLKYTDGYAPLARGMAAALPYVDDFVEGHSLDAVRELAALIDR
ncbi:MAG: VWA domain-containing protein [Actinomycetota bacterium]